MILGLDSKRASFMVKLITPVGLTGVFILWAWLNVKAREHANKFLLTFTVAFQNQIREDYLSFNNCVDKYSKIAD